MSADTLKLTTYFGERDRAGGRLVCDALLDVYGRAGIEVSLLLRGVWGFHGDHASHGDRLLRLRRRVPVVTVVIDTPGRIAASFGIVDELTAGTGLVTSEMVPTAVATHEKERRGGLHMARHRL